MKEIPRHPSRLAPLVAVALFTITLLVFARAWPHEFLNYDDPDYVTANPHVKAGLTAASVRWAFSTSDISYWHPLTWLSHMADWQVFGANPHGHHATSVVFHALNALLAFIVLRRLTGAVWASAFVAAIFALHPLRAESVGWIAERKDVLSGFFWLAAIWAYARYSEGAGPPMSAKQPTLPTKGTRRPMGWYFASLALFAAGLMSKPMVVTLPAILLVLDWWPLNRLDRGNWVRRVIEKIPFAALSVIVAVITVHAQEKIGTLSTELPLTARLANAVVSIVRYLEKFFAPVNLAVLYPHPGFWPARIVWVSATAVAVLTMVAILQARRRPWLLVGWLWFLIALLPASGIVQVGIQSMADRYTYLPMLGVTLAVVWTLREFAGAMTLPRGSVVAVVILALGALATTTWRQLGYWANSFALFDHTLAVAPAGNYLSYNNRGLALYAAGNVDGALADYRRSLAINPTWAETNNNLGYTLAMAGHPAEALPFYETALRSRPNHLEVHNNLGNALADLGQLDEAIQHYQFVLARAPQHLNALNGYGVALAMQQKLPEAIAKFETVLTLDPENATAHGNLGNALALLGRRDEAIAHYQRALAAKPDDAQSWHNLANVLSDLGRLDDAMRDYQRSIQLAPTNPSAHANLGRVLARLGRRDEAIRELQIALQQQPGHQQAAAWLQALTGTTAKP
jgi:protein O-mannosyl-transferase